MVRSSGSGKTGTEHLEWPGGLPDCGYGQADACLEDWGNGLMLRLLLRQG